MAETLLRDQLTRCATDIRIRYRRTTESALSTEGGRVRDLNERGAWVELPERVAARSALVIVLETPQGDLPLVAHVAWTCPELCAPPFLHGLLFTSVTPERRQRLRALIDHNHAPRAVRLYCTLAATCQHLGVVCPAVPSVIRDVSGSGVGLHLPEPVAPGSEMSIRAATPFGRIAADARVVWAEEPTPRPRGMLYRHGLRFLRLDPWSELPLQAFLCGIHLTWPRPNGR
jgi:hypothetical protein